MGSVLIDVNEEWMDMNFIDAASLRGVERSAREPEPPTPELLERARLIVVGGDRGEEEGGVSRTV
ncbi:hypothetical protein [Enorma phocaeensis]|uniref:Uncharacterized protein n=1 Tax=Enorma phocaeensis TaxID=1871019 RepID=A0A921ISW3_9ACTN|nr:hypothetical protein [Enorma phocaeensis]HJG36936.1 hypothetical protein [Enorma phocaeensis]